MGKLCDVLWIEDDAEGSKSFITLCEASGIKLHIYTTRDEGCRELEKDKSKWDAVILDAKCPVRENSVANITGLGNILQVIGKSIPTFVYTGQPDIISDCVFKEMCGEVPIYEKGKGTRPLIEAVLESTKKMAKIKRRYAQIFNIVEKRFGENAIEIEDILLKMLTPLHFEDERFRFQADAYLVVLRKLLEYLFRVYHSYGLLPDECIPGGKVNLTYCSLYLSGKKVENGGWSVKSKLNIVPEYMSYNIRSIIETGGIGAHTPDVKGVPIIGCVESLVYGYALHLCDMIIWQDDYIETHPIKKENQAMCIRPKRTPMLEEIRQMYEGKEVVPEKDEDGIWHYEECCVPIDGFRPGFKFYIEQIGLNKDDKTKNKYKYYIKYRKVK